MAASPVLLTPHRIAPSHSVRSHWIYVLFSVVFVACTSNRYFGGMYSGVVVNAVWRAVLGPWHYEMRGEANEVLRKVGHFFGYGIVGLIFRSAWYSSARAFAWVTQRWLTLFASALAVLSTFLLACLDEWHQHYVPGRVGSVRDAMIDASGALVLSVFVWELRVYRRNKVLPKSA
jgi:VanZ family protein